MLVHRPHLRALNRALAAAEPLLILPDLHPDYLRALFTEWQALPPAAEGDVKPRVILFEHGWGASKLAIDVLEPLGQSPNVAEWLRARIHDVPGKEPDTTGRPRRPHTLYWLAGGEDLLANDDARAALGALCRRIATYDLPWRVLLEDPARPLPRPLAPWGRVLELKAPRPDEDDDFAARVLRALAPDFCAAVEQEEDGKDRLRELTRQVQGLDAASINLVFSDAVRSMPSASLDVRREHILRRSKQERDRLLQRASGLILERVGDEELLGMNRLQRHLEYVDVLLSDFTAGDAAGGPRPRGVLLAGLPGCGKSLAARIAAKRLNVPLLRLDVGGVMGRYLGESEANLRRALDAAEASAPCVLWVDEIEKALGGLGGGSEGGGTGSRVLAHLLTWMQDHESQVYLFATANAVAKLPPELLRRGRFDELWKVMLPTADERLEILASKLSKLEDSLDDELRDAKNSRALRKFAETAAEGFTGADLESLVSEAWSRARVHKQQVGVESLRAVIKSGFKPMSVQFKDQIDAATKQLEAHGFLDVSCPDDELPPEVPPERRAKRGELVGPLADFWQSPDGSAWEVPDRDLKLTFLQDSAQEDGVRTLGCAKLSDGEELGVARVRRQRSTLRVSLPEAAQEIAWGWHEGPDHIGWEGSPVVLRPHAGGRSGRSGRSGRQRYLVDGRPTDPRLPRLGDVLVFTAEGRRCVLSIFEDCSILRVAPAGSNMKRDDLLRPRTPKELRQLSVLQSYYKTDWYSPEYEHPNKWPLILVAPTTEGDDAPIKLVIMPPISGEPDTVRMSLSFPKHVSRSLLIACADLYADEARSEHRSKADKDLMARARIKFLKTQYTSLSRIARYRKWANDILNWEKWRGGTGTSDAGAQVLYRKELKEELAQWR